MMCSEGVNEVLIRSNRSRIDQLREDENALGAMVVAQQVAIAQMQVRLNEQETIISLLCRDLGIVPKEVQS